MSQPDYRRRHNGRQARDKPGTNHRRRRRLLTVNLIDDELSIWPCMHIIVDNRQLRLIAQV